MRWVWVQGNHTTTSVAGSPEVWDVVISSSNQTYSHTFTNTGTFWYYCRPHGFDNGDGTAGGMAGTVTVLPAASGACCLSAGMCLVTLPADCLSQGGTYEGDGTTCDPDPCAVEPITVSLFAQKDNILYETVDGSLSNALGRYLYVGNQNSGAMRRSVIQFDTSSIPTGATVQSATLRLYCNQSSGAAFDVTLQRLLADWGEGTSLASGNEGSGGSATTGDATWLHRFWPGLFWTVPGGDFVAQVSGTTSISADNTFYTWSGEGITGDVQHWVDMPAMNFGWIVRGDEASSNNTKRFDSRNGPTPENHPTLTITFLPPEPSGACCLPDGDCIEVSESDCMTEGGIYQGNGTECQLVNCPIQLEPFVDELPRPGLAQPITGAPGGAAHYEIAMTEQFQQLHRDLPPTRVWGYAGAYPGPTIEARRGETVTVIWENDLRVWETGELRTTHALSVDTCLHGPDMTGEVPVGVVHLHGGKVAPESDGYPEDAFPPGEQSPLYIYPNDQPAATIWYHDHALGITRLNVMMGMAGFYLIRDDDEDALNLPGGTYEIAMAIQDRSFYPDGSLRYHEMWHDHFFGEVILVNGKVWPYLEVDRGKYRFRMVNGSNSRAYMLSLSNGATFWQIGTDMGLLEAPVPLTGVTFLPGERVDIVIDFSSYAPGTEIILTNSAPAPFPGFPGVGVIPNVMKFIVQEAIGHTDSLPEFLVEVPPIPESESVIERVLELKTIPNTHCPDHHDALWTIDGLLWHDITEFPKLGSTEIWTWKNNSGISHPMHLHLVAVQILDRQAIDDTTGEPTGPKILPEPNERGWKDTVDSPPGYFTRVIARFEGFTGLYPYHCHILEHEDHEMMRQFRVVECLTDSDCDDGLYCNGAETCDQITFTCQPGIPPDCDDGVACTLDACDEDTQSCTHTPDHTFCDNDQFCDGIEYCDEILGCQSGPPPCEDECEDCDEDAGVCNWCIFDLDFNGVMGTGDFALFAGCFEGCYSTEDPCYAANFDGSADGCIGSADFAAFAGCFADTCGECATCSGPVTTSTAVTSGTTKPEVVIRLAVVAEPSSADLSSEPPLSLGSVTVGQALVIEVWMARFVDSAPNNRGLAAAYVDLLYDPRLLSITEVRPGGTVTLFAGGYDDNGVVRAAGGCALLGERSLGSDGSWIRVATIKARARASGIGSLSAKSSGPIHGIALVGEFANIGPEGIDFDSVPLVIESKKRPVRNWPIR